jgi:tyrosine-protein phosphatase SIW14
MTFSHPGSTTSGADRRLVAAILRCFWWVIIALMVSGAFIQSSAAADHLETAKPATPRDDLPGLKNFAIVSDALWRGAQPTAEGFAELKRRGVKTVVDLRSAHSDRDLMAGTGLQYVEIPCHAWHPEEEDVLGFLKIISDRKNQPVYVHCAAGADRTGTMVAVYRILEQGWATDDAVKELSSFHFHPVFGEVVTFLKKFDRGTTRKKLETINPPKVEVIR